MMKQTVTTAQTATTAANIKLSFSDKHFTDGNRSNLDASPNVKFYLKIVQHF